MLSWFMHLNPVDRKGPTSLEELHSTTLARWQAEGKSGDFNPYRPGSLAALHDLLTDHHEGTMYAEADKKASSEIV